MELRVSEGCAQVTFSDLDIGDFFQFMDRPCVWMKINPDMCGRDLRDDFSRAEGNGMAVLMSFNGGKSPFKIGDMTSCGHNSRITWLKQKTPAIFHRGSDE